MGNEKEIRLPWPGWTIGKYLGAGGYGKVYEIERTLSGVRERAALKVVSRPADDAEIEACYENGYDQASMKASYEEEIQRYVKEYELMKELQGWIANIRLTMIHENYNVSDLDRSSDMLPPLKSQILKWGLLAQ